MEEYIKKLLDQVRFKKAHKGIEDELRAHIEDQIEDNMASGMNREAAEKAAVADMGDPVEVGISMDRIHKPQMAWSMVIAAIIFRRPSKRYQKVNRRMEEREARRLVATSQRMP